MNPGDLVQIRHDEYLPEGTVAKPPVKSGLHPFWIYAEVREVNLTSVKVRVKHPRNRLHGEILDVARADIRTKADVLRMAQAERDPIRQKHFANQAKVLS
jgi:hypothetical protein